MKRFILTGAPGAGKTSILRALAAGGYAVVPEAATDVMTARLAPARPSPGLTRCSSTGLPRCNGSAGKRRCARALPCRYTTGRRSAHSRSRGTSGTRSRRCWSRRSPGRPAMVPSIAGCSSSGCSGSSSPRRCAGSATPNHRHSSGSTRTPTGAWASTSSMYPPDRRRTSRDDRRAHQILGLTPALACSPASGRSEPRFATSSPYRRKAATPSSDPWREGSASARPPCANGNALAWSSRAATRRRATGSTAQPRYETPYWPTSSRRGGYLLGQIAC